MGVIVVRAGFLGTRHALWAVALTKASSPARPFSARRPGALMMLSGEVSVRVDRPSVFASALSPGDPADVARTADPVLIKDWA